MKIAVIGAGAMGCLFGAKLAIAGNDVTMISSTPEKVTIMRDRGILITEDGTEQTAHVNASLASDMHDDIELFILFTKTMNSIAALDSVKHLITERTYILSLQNGLGNDEILTNYVEPDYAMIGVTNYPSDVIAAAEVRSQNNGFVKFMSVSGQMTDMAVSLNRTFTGAGINSSIEPDILVYIWEKAAFNAALNSLCAICDIPCGGVGRTSDGMKLARNIAQEAVDVAAARGIHIDLERINSMVEASVREHAGHFPSMAQDVQNRRKTEIESINGAISGYGMQNGIATPCCDTVLQLLHIMEANYR